MHRDIYTLIRSEEENFKLPIPVVENWEWSAYEHIKLTVLYKNSVYSSGKFGDKPFKNITRPILNVQYRAEGFDLKDIELYIESEEHYHKSFLVKKYHEDVFAIENNVDEMIDQIVESYVDFGGVLVKKIKGKVPEVVPLQRLAFFDQTAMLSGPIAERHSFSPEELREMPWENIDEVITLAQAEKTINTDTRKAKTPGKYIEVYEVHGEFPRYWLYDTNNDGKYTGYWYKEDADEMELVRQVHICTFYQDTEGKTNGISLFKSEEPNHPYKFLARDKIYNRALGLGGGEELFEPQVWTNYDVIRLRDMLDAASKVIFKTTDPTVQSKHPTGLKNLNNLEILELSDGTDLNQLDTFPRNATLFDRSIEGWERHAQQMGAANESILGEQPSSGTPFKLQELVTAESHSLHEYRKGKLAKFIEEIYRDWIIPHISKEIVNGKKFLSKLSLSELQEIGERIVKNKANGKVKESILSGELPNKEEMESFKEASMQQFMDEGNERFIEILKGEMRSVAVRVKINIAGKQKDLAGRTDKLVNVFRTIMANPNVLANPAMAKLFNEILESSGLSPLDFSSFSLPQPQSETKSSQTQPLQDINKEKTLAQKVA